MDDSVFAKIIQNALKDIPKEFLDKMENVEIVSQDWPHPGQIQFLRKRGEGSVLLGLYEGVPQTRRGRYGIGPTIPDKITIFKNPLISISANLRDLEENVKKTVIHEIAHHFGMSEENLRKLEKHKS